MNKSDIIVLVTTFVLTVVFDLVVAIEVGMVLACLLFMKRIRNIKINEWILSCDEVCSEEDESVTIDEDKAIDRIVEKIGAELLDF